MQVSFILDGERGAKYRLLCSRRVSDVGGGVLWEIQHYRNTRAKGGHWVTVASGREPTNDMPSRVLAGFLTTPMPNAKTVHELSRRVKGEPNG